MDKNLPLLTMFLRKLSFFRTFPSIKSQESYRNLCPAKKHGCPVVAPQAYVHSILCRCLLMRQAFSESCYFSLDIDPTNTMAYCTATTTMQRCAATNNAALTPPPLLCYHHYHHCHRYCAIATATLSPLPYSHGTAPTMPLPHAH
jgi:hypothetical protein